MKALVVGLGIGNLYCAVLKNLNFDVSTVDLDSSKSPTYTKVEDAQGPFDLAVICTPNFTHEKYARALAPLCKLILVEKPGVLTASSWKNMQEDFPNTKFMMVKNNQYRDSIDYFESLVKKSKVIEVIWNNKNRIPSPGSWFTTKDLSFGGVSRDLIPHMLSYLCKLSDYKTSEKQFVYYEQRYNLDNIDSTDYGTINKEGTYNVDDVCELRYSSNGKTWILRADWKSNTDDDVYIQFDNSIKIPLGLCPESAYQTMIQTAVQNLNNDVFWKEQSLQDIWIHEQIENI